jgi:predicted O-linked N-acetylglucosamine transferase (SPINDLY family)
MSKHLPSAEQDIGPGDRSVAMLNQAGIAALKAGEFEQGTALLNRSLKLQTAQPQLRVGLAAALLDRGRAAEALTQLDLALRAQPKFPEALYNRANALMTLARPQEAIADYNRAIALKPDFPLAFNNRGNAQHQLGREEQALGSFEKALTLNPRFALAHSNRGDVLLSLGRHRDALDAYQRAMHVLADPADTFAAEMHGKCGVVLLEMKRPAQALMAFNRYLADCPMSAQGHNNRGAALLRLNQLPEALLSFQRALELAPEFPEAHNNRGTALFKMLRNAEALSCFEKAIELRPAMADAFLNGGLALKELDRHGEAASYFEHYQGLHPASAQGLGLRFHALQNCCDWRDYQSQVERILQAVRQGRDAEQPFSMLSLSDDAGAQLACARTYVHHGAPPAATALAPATPYAHERVRVGYLSGDFRDHAIAYLMAGVLEQHDAMRFESFAFSLRPADPGPYGQRIGAAVSQFIDLSALSDTEAAAQIRAHEIDILIDLAGFTQGSRSAILAQRPAPLQLNYLGFPGTLGAPYIDYLIADPYLIPESLQPHYAEQILYLPECFQANDDQRPFSSKPPSRSELGLPEHGPVLCCFNNSYKITPRFFSVWMRLLAASPESVLWLVASTELVQQNLRREAQRRGIDPNRLIFAPRVPYAQHLGRLGRADLFLDTLPFNGGTTASDALWAGLPVLTCSGQAFAARMAGSLLSALALPELICTDLDSYEQLAGALLREPQRLADLKARLLAQRLTSPLFNTKRFTRHLEAAYLQAYQRHQQQQPPKHLHIGALP